MTILKECGRCHNKLPETDFHMTKEKRASYCKTCMSYYSSCLEKCTKCSKTRKLKQSKCVKCWKMDNKRFCAYCHKIKDFFQQQYCLICLPKYRQAKYKKGIVDRRKRAYQSAKYRAKNRNRSMEFTQEAWLKKVDSKCHYCGTSDVVGLDRVDSNLGYTHQNTVPACEICQKSKNSLPLEGWLSHMRRVLQYFND